MTHGHQGGTAVIVGAGPNGLAAGIVLAQAGWAVRIYEANERLGGGARSEALTEPGYVHDTCSAVYPLAAGSPFFQALQLERYGLAYVHPGVALAHPFDDGSAAVLDRSMERTVRSFMSGVDAKAHRGLVEPMVNQWHVVAEEVLGPPHVPRGVERAILLGRFGMSALRSAWGFARGVYEGERARALFGGVASHSTVALEQAGSAAIGLVLMLAGHAVGWPLARGGAQRISDALAALLGDVGGEIFTGQRIERFEQLPGADAYLFDVTPRQLVAIAGDRLPGGYRGRLGGYRYGAGSFKVDWALSGPIPWKAEACREAGTVHVGGTLEEIAASERAVNSGRVTERPFVLVTQPSLFDDSRAPQGMHTGWAYCHVPHGSAVDMTDAIERQVERFAPGFRDLIVARHTMNAVELERRNANLIGGDINGGMLSLRQLLFRPVMRLSPYTTPNERIYLCSASTPPGVGVHGMCGYHAAQAVLKRWR